MQRALQRAPSSALPCPGAARPAFWLCTAASMHSLRSRAGRQGPGPPHWPAPAASGGRHAAGARSAAATLPAACTAADRRQLQQPRQPPVFTGCLCVGQPQLLATTAAASLWLTSSAPPPCSLVNEEYKLWKKNSPFLVSAAANSGTALAAAVCGTCCDRCSAVQAWCHTTWPLVADHQPCVPIPLLAVW